MISRKPGLKAMKSVRLLPLPKRLPWTARSLTKWQGPESLGLLTLGYGRGPCTGGAGHRCRPHHSPAVWTEEAAWPLSLDFLAYKMVTASLGGCQD